MRVLLIEDDRSIAQSIELMLKSESFNVYSTDLGEEGVDLGKLYDYDIILLDLNLPDMSGFDVLRSLRLSRVNTPILILSGLTGIDDKVKCLGFGADDYLTKPFHKTELIARIQAIVRRSRGHAQSVVQIGDLTVNVDAKTVHIDKAQVHLTGREYQMLELLSLRRGTTITKEVFLSQLYGGMDEPEIKIIDVFICKIRKKSSLRHRTARTTLRLCGAEATCYVSRRGLRRGSLRDDAVERSRPVTLCRLPSFLGRATIANAVTRRPRPPVHSRGKR
jgi:two-component system cell cycle response regulator CtrA